MSKKVYISILFLFIGVKVAIAQTQWSNRLERRISVKVIDKATNKLIENAEIFVNGNIFRHSGGLNGYVIRAKIGDEILVMHPDFETVYFTVESWGNITVEIKGFDGRRVSKYGRLKERGSNNRSTPSKKVDMYNTLLDSAKYYKKKNIDKSLSFIEGILAGRETNNRNAATYATLGDIYLYWNQYDLAISNYMNSLNYKYSAKTSISLGGTYVLSKNFQQARRVFNDVLDKRLTKYERISAYEGLGDAFFGLKKFKLSKDNYEKGLKIASDNRIKAKVTDLNVKIGEVYGAEGNLVQAKKSFTNSINSAKTENLDRSLKVQDKVADFFNQKNQFDDEIQLRKQTLKDILATDTISFNYEIEGNNKLNKPVVPSKKKNLGNVEKLKDSKQDSTINFSDTDVITPQSLNYKIGRAYTQKEEYKKAIPFLKNSVENKGRADNLEIKKDATRKLSESFANVGEYDKALKSYQDYVALVDQTYIRKEQEIAQAKRFAKKIADNQNRIASLEKDKAFKSTKIDLAYKDQQLSEERNRNQLIVIYSLIAGVIGLFMVAYLLYRSNRQQKLANNLLALKSMRSQMNPHFIFNALNSVNSFIAVNDERNANRYLSEFSVLMRSVLENSDEDFIPLAKEIELLELYVKLEYNRFKDKFDYTVEVDKSIDLDQFSIPPMLLQPYIENAIWHGLRYKKEMGMLSISITQKDTETVHICIQDDGVGRKKSMELKTKNQLKQKSKGMSTIQNRVEILNNMYGDRISVAISDLAEDGTGTKVELLLRKN